MEILLLMVGLAIQIFMIVVAFKYGGLMWAFLGAFSGIAVILTLLESGADITYISNGVLVTVSSGGFFFLIPVLLLIMSLLQIIQLK